MAESITAGPEPASRERSGSRQAFDHFASFYVIYLSVFFFLILYVLSVEVVEGLLQDSFEVEIERAVRVSPIDGPIVPQIQNRVTEILQTSPWTLMRAMPTRTWPCAAFTQATWTARPWRDTNCRRRSCWPWARGCRNWILWPRFS